MDTSLPFFAAQYTYSTVEQWDLHFDRLFPSQQPGCIPQNLHKCTYYINWLTLISQLNQQYIQRVRATFRTKFDTLAWIPYTQSNRMWATRVNEGRAWFRLPEHQPATGPQIAINPWAH